MSLRGRRMNGKVGHSEEVNMNDNAKVFKNQLVQNAQVNPQGYQGNYGPSFGPAYGPFPGPNCGDCCDGGYCDDGNYNDCGQGCPGNQFIVPPWACGDLQIAPTFSLGITGQLGCKVCMCPSNDTTACSNGYCIGCAPGYVGPNCCGNGYLGPYTA